MTVPLTERFHQRVNWPPGSWHPPDRRSSHTLWPKTTEYHSSANTVSHPITYQKSFYERIL